MKTTQTVLDKKRFVTTPPMYAHRYKHFYVLTKSHDWFAVGKECWWRGTNLYDTSIGTRRLSSITYVKGQDVDGLVFHVLTSFLFRVCALVFPIRRGITVSDGRILAFTNSTFCVLKRSTCGISRNKSSSQLLNKEDVVMPWLAISCIHVYQIWEMNTNTRQSLFDFRWPYPEWISMKIWA